MKVHFKVPKMLDGKKYPVGTHEVSDAMAGHWYLLASVQNKECVITEEPVALESSPLESEDEAPKPVSKQKKKSAPKQVEAEQG